jgi:hypothetical protein
MIQINFLRKKQVQHSITINKAEDVAKTISDFLSTKTEKGWKTEVTLTQDLGASMGYGGDSYPYTIHAISNDGKKVFFSDDQYSWDHENKTYVYNNINHNNPAAWQSFKLQKDGRFKNASKGRAINIGFRRFYQDPHF